MILALRTPVVAWLLLWLLAGCESSAFQTNTGAASVQTTQLITPVLLPSPTTEPVPTPQLTPQPVILSLWFPEPLAPIDNVEAAELLSEQISAFQFASAADAVAVDFRLKSVDDVGGIMPTLRAASAVAPGVIPDLTLLRRSDLVAAADAGLIAPLRESANTAILGNYAPIVNALGRVDGVLYGLPYNVDIEHLVGVPSAIQSQMGDFVTFLDGDVSLLFAAGATNTLSSVLLAQYREAAGLLNDGSLRVELDPLRQVFTYYERAVEEGLVDTNVLEYTQAEEYADTLTTGSVVGVLTSGQFLDLERVAGLSGQNLAYAPFPTVSGRGTTVVDGWMWVITTRDAQEQEVALQFINWMMEAERQTAYQQSINVMPSQESALDLWGDVEYAAFVDALLAQGTLPLVGGDSAVPARVISSAFASVIAGRFSAAEAIADVQRQLGG